MSAANVQTTLVILLAVGYLVLLVMAIIVAVLLIKILQTVRNITAKTEAGIDNMAETVKTFGKRLAPVAVSSLIGVFAKRMRNRRKYKDNDED